MIARRFFYTCAGLLCLAFAYHLGALNVSAHAASTEEQSSARLVARALIIVDDKGQTRAELGTGDGGRPLLYLFDHTGVRRAAFALDRDGAAVLGLNGSNGNVRAMLEGGDHPMLRLFDSTDRVVWKAPR